MIDVVILGASGYGGGELLRLLSQHPQVGSLCAVSRNHAGKALHSVHPNLRGLLPGSFEAEVDWGAFAQAETPVLFAALPHGEFAKLYDQLEQTWIALEATRKLTVVDLSGDFRLADPQSFAQAYHGAHPCPQFLGQFVYGLSEYRREQLRGATRIANPGCFATALALGLLPLAELPAQARPEFVAISAITGSSGSGASPGEGTHHPLRAHDFRAYKMLNHQHEAEVQRILREHGWEANFSFVPHSAPLVRGIHATLQFRLAPQWQGHLRELLAARYPEGGFVRLVEGAPRLAAVAGSNFVDLGLSFRGDQACLLVTLDNLIKGMAGQAIQNLNLALGWPEGTGLRQAALWPG